MNRQFEQAKRHLLEHARAVSRQHQGDVATWDGIVMHRLSGSARCLPGYIPYIGKKFFSARTRIITYALSQNIRADDDWAIEWARDWHESSGELALDRQNEAYSDGGRIAMHPFDTGHLPILASFARFLSNGSRRVASSIYEEIAATNLSKYSFRTPTNLTCDSESGLVRCFNWYGAKELEVLKPQVVIAAGAQVSTILSTALSNTSIRVISVQFPSTRVINIHFRRKFHPTEAQVKALKNALAPKDLVRGVLPNSRPLAQVIEKDAPYFWPMFERMASQLAVGK